MMRPATRTLTRGFSSCSRSLLRVLRQNLRNRVGDFVLAGIDLLSQSFNLFQLLPPQFVNLLVEGQWIPCLLSSLSRIVNSDYKQVADKKTFWIA